MIISKIQYISQGTTAVQQEYNIHKVLDAGVEWIQLRWKYSSENQLFELGEKVKKLCTTYNATLIINDSIKLAKALDADGVHLGLEDESIALAIDSLGKNKIIGGTANSLEQVIRRAKEGCHYIGVGPFRFTATKEKLSPILGLDGYQKLFESLQLTDRTIPPIVAIGGIQISDVAELRATGVHGVAMSTTLTQQPSLFRQIKIQLT